MDSYYNTPYKGYVKTPIEKLIKLKLLIQTKKTYTDYL